MESWDTRETRPVIVWRFGVRTCDRNDSLIKVAWRLGCGKDWFLLNSSRDLYDSYYNRVWQQWRRFMDPCSLSSLKKSFNSVELPVIPPYLRFRLLSTSALSWFSFIDFKKSKTIKKWLLFKSLHRITCNQVTNGQFKRYDRSRTKYNAHFQLPDVNVGQYHPYSGRISTRNFRTIVFQMNSFLQEFRAISKFVSLMILCETFVLLIFILALYVGF